MSETNVFIINSPLQLLGALEAQYHFKIAPENSVLIVIQYQILKEIQPEIGIIQISKLIELKDWNEIYFLGGHQFNFFYRIARLRQIKKIIDKLNPVNMLFTSRKESHLVKFFVNQTNPKSIFLLDDGLGTIYYSNERRIQTTNVKSKPLRKLMFEIFSRLIGYDASPFFNFKYFTYYDLPEDSANGVVRHNFEKLQLHNKSKQVSDEAWLLGSGIGIRSMDEKLYLEYMVSIKSFYHPKKLVFIPHRFENPSLCRKIATDLNIEVRRFNLPVEAELAAGNTVPNILAGFASTALETCLKIFPTIPNINAIYIPSDHFILPIRQSHFNSHYKHYEKINDPRFKLIDLKILKTE